MQVGELYRSQDRYLLGYLPGRAVLSRPRNTTGVAEESTARWGQARHWLTRRADWQTRPGEWKRRPRTLLSPSGTLPERSGAFPRGRISSVCIPPGYTGLPTG